jgi:membrane peptidoglycan carboxypeptidase
MPKHLVKAFLAAEDARFFEHEGISYSAYSGRCEEPLAGKVVRAAPPSPSRWPKLFPYP